MVLFVTERVPVVVVALGTALALYATGVLDLGQALGGLGDTTVIFQLISNTATALIIFPIAVASAVELGISPRPVLMSVNVAAAAAFLTPVATPVNLMVMGPGGYEFGDYWKLGLPCLLLFFVVAVVLVPLVWSF